FPAAAYAVPLRSNLRLQQALDAAISSGPGGAWPTPVCVVSLESPAGAHPVASYRGAEVDYSASLVKVAAMYAAFELRGTLRAIAQELGGSVAPADVLSKAGSYLNPRIMGRIKTIPPLRGIDREHAVPRYTKAFQVAGGDVDFTPAFKDSLKQMISVSSNADAASCIHGCGYGYLNGALASAGFFDPSTTTGLWLAGDYVHQYPYFRIPSVNDGQIAQGATVFSLATLFTLLFDRTLVDSASSDEMLTLLTTSVAAGEVYITRASGLDFTVTNGKLGLGPLKSGGDVCSEAAILQHTSGALFVAAWQNFTYRDPDGFDPIAHVVRDTIDGYLAP
ncbi:MAG TPA: hypothetical protein VE987_07450, partial [Polyangiaceae bacterium]|nr:hypothetical protein [Polyangiaceae bacterium]